ncbi:hypothetical protein D3C75_817220 [compost metagenome]
MVVSANAGKGQQLFIIGDGDCADIQLLMQHLRHFHAVFLVKTLAQNPFGRGRHF